jgi:hypothetical protein
MVISPAITAVAAATLTVADATSPPPRKAPVLSA